MTGRRPYAFRAASARSDDRRVPSLERRPSSDFIIGVSQAEPYPPTRAELLISNAELRSLNAALTARNSQLEAGLQRQRATSNDLENILNSNEVATLFVDTSLRVRFFTPAARALFQVIGSDVGRPLADFASLAADDELLADARRLLRTLTPIEREIEAPAGVWRLRRILPYRGPTSIVQGVVVTFTDITERREIGRAIEAAKQLAERAQISAADQIAKLTARQHQILDLVLAGQPSKIIAADLGISQRTVENHRASIMRKTGSKSLPALARLAVAADTSHLEALVG
jgi:two-component system CheB/CheR fusion protein